MLFSRETCIYRNHNVLMKSCLKMLQSSFWSREGCFPVCLWDLTPTYNFIITRGSRLCRHAKGLVYGLFCCAPCGLCHFAHSVLVRAQSPTPVSSPSKKSSLWLWTVTMCGGAHAFLFLLPTQTKPGESLNRGTAVPFFHAHVSLILTTGHKNVSTFCS